MALFLRLHFSLISSSLNSTNPQPNVVCPGNLRFRSGALKNSPIKRGRTEFKRQVCNASYGNPGSTGALTPELKEALDKFIASHRVVLFMKGTKDFPQCGFSNTLVQILNSLNAQFETVNILENDALRQGLKEYSSWPTFPQLYIDGKFFGGCDITVEAYKKGELQELLKATSS